MDKNEMILTLRKNKLDMEHEALLQEREIILIAETGIPITALNITITAQLYAHPLPVVVVAASALAIGFIEWLRRRNNKRITEKRQEIDQFILELNK